MVVKIYGWWELTFSVGVAEETETSFPILSLQALLMEISSHNLFKRQFFGSPNIRDSQNAVWLASEELRISA